MKLVSVRVNRGTILGLLSGDRIVNVARTYAAHFRDSRVLHLGSMHTFLEGGQEALDALRQVAALAEEDPERVFWISEPIGPTVPRPPKLFCLAGNYAEHIQEGGGEVLQKAETTPRVFMKPPSTTVIGHGDPIVIPRHGRWIDWEAELAVVIGRRGKHISAQEALDYVAGYTILNDVSERQLAVPETRRPREGDRWFDWLNGKWCDTFAPMGPCLVTRDEIPDPQSLRITLRVNGEVKQDASTAQMIFTCAELIEWISRWITLEPGDVIATGTPAGVGRARGEKLRPGDVVEVQIERIGTLSNPVIAEE
ncbi:MAG: 2-hydroxyhepta-2,4-diene-1,7-dioate isomerase [Candidatus Poribacteria bacterium]|nr:MAG: 2-hydroxyhepta-2,4-diene-1,7-dioate isomerase [Candidatus Poribacteria bacterium]